MNQTEANIDHLIKQAQQGDRDAFSEVIEHHYDLMYRYALKLARNDADAQDITQLSCVKLARGIRQFRFESAFSTWIYRLVTNCTKDYYRRTSTEHTHDVPESAVVDSSESSVLLTQVLAQIEKLGDGFKETICLVIGESMTHREAAIILGVKESTVSWRIHEARKHLHTFMSSEKSE